ncbi:MAG: ABC transporter permease subunit [Candidatus Rokubacteria bacterium]|nr:ABC transporter permease subunit [Candidatus Rokubacteria bacterium]
MSVAAARLAILATFLLAWEAGARALNPLLYVPPSTVAPALVQLLGLTSYPALPEHLTQTVVEIVVAYGLAVVSGLGLGFALGLWPRLGRVYAPILSVLYAIPSVVWYPSLMLVFGLGAASKIAFGFLLGFFPIVLTVLAGIRQVDRHLVIVARSMGARPLTLFLKVLIPSMASTLVGGLRAGLALSVVGVIVGEVLGSRAGLGYLLTYTYGLLRTADYIALVCVAVALVFAIDTLAGLFEHRAKRWSA